MSNQQTGKLLVKNDTEQVSEKFKKREFVLEITEDINGNNYTNYAKFQCVQNKCDILDRFKIGDNLTVSFNIKGNRWERDGKVNYITNLDAWRVELAGGQQQGTGYVANQQPVQQQSYNTNTPASSQIDDLPF